MLYYTIYNTVLYQNLAPAACIPYDSLIRYQSSAEHSGCCIKPPGFYLILSPSTWSDYIKPMYLTWRFEGNSRVVKLLAPGTVLSSHWFTRRGLMWDTTFFPHTRLERVGIILIHGKGPGSSSLYSKYRRKPTHWHNCVGVLSRNERFTKTGIYIKTYRCSFEQLTSRFWQFNFREEVRQQRSRVHKSQH